ncbi:MAG: tRNA (N(6)-L-threonylcarbamoyladenosine(37)-C(2))-methylthiotransferase MtaB [Clostridia bacterium]|nr:tRNA (N(6)-L-threonylcarbamoyladenosine(37)-C(2))-methylthiotransferase MtaB [Clostridia bacterium]
MNVCFYTLGCKVNQYETQSMREEFERNGFTAVSDSIADIVVINSCTVTAESDRKTRQLLHRIRRQNPNAVIVLTGCMAQTFSGDKSELTDADIVVGNRDTSKILKLTQEFIKDKKTIFDICPHERNELFNTPEISDFAERTRAYMKIEDGCDRYCSYCIIPYARGFVRSRPCEDIKKEAEVLASKGFREIVLVGINLSAYGKGENINLCDAVDAVCEADGIERVRLGSLEPDHISDGMLNRFKNQPKFCPQFHLSLQSGCDATLKRMNRHYDTAFYADLVKRIRQMFPDATITTDIMVGFAGETEEEFLQSVEFLRKIEFAKAHVFAYSRRKGTVADRLPNQITRAEKSRRSRIMIEAASRCEEEILCQQIGKTLEVLFETTEDGKAFGYTKNYLRVAVKTDKILDGETANVKILSVEKDYCVGEL